MFAIDWSGLWEFIWEHREWAAGALGVMAAAAWALLRGWTQVRLRRFLERINISINSLRKQADELATLTPRQRALIPEADREKQWRLKFRTLFEDQAGEVWLNNAWLIARVVYAARLTKAGRPFLEFTSVAQRQMVYQACQNVMSELCAEGHMADANGMPVDRYWCVIALACEKDPSLRLNKTRLMVMPETELLELADTPNKYTAENTAFEGPTHNVRLDTLKLMAVRYKQQADAIAKGGPGANPWLCARVEIVIKK